MPEAVSLIEQSQLLLASWFGAGLVEPLRAGLAAASVWPLTVVLSGRAPVALIATAILVAVVGAWSADAWQILLSIEDDRRIVIDEVGGYLAGMALLGQTGWLAAGGFGALFLTLDRLKPWPFDKLEAVPGGVGVMLDDIALGLALAVAIVFVVAARRRMGNM